MNGAPAKPMSGVAPSSPTRLRTASATGSTADESRTGSSLDIGRGPDRAGDDRPDAGLDVEVHSRGLDRKDDVAEQDRGIDAVAANRLHRELGDEVRPKARLEHPDALAQLAILRQRATCLPHEPHRRMRHGLATASTQERAVSEVGHASIVSRQPAPAAASRATPDKAAHTPTSCTRVSRSW